MAKRILILTNEEVEKMNANSKLCASLSEGEGTLISFDSDKRDEAYDSDKRDEA